jgi:hypothetical protein
LGVEVTPGGVHDAAEIETAVSSFVMKENGGIVILPHAITRAHEKLTIALKLRHRLPAVCASEGSVNAAGSPPTESISGTIFARPPSTSIAFFVARNQAIFRYSNPPFQARLQSQDREGHRSRNSADLARTRRRDD